ncbi:MAG: complex I NDUFA9 subunit family protein [Gammaproteobacteria bacterium]|nr:complex I NDUFA9 subunit family protein [Gammaproteobacteria bacterium]
MVPKKICILGGTGFVGHRLVYRLVKEGYQIKIITRRPERHRDLLVLPTVELESTNIFDIDQLSSSLAGYDTVINLIGILNAADNSGNEFRKIHVELTHTIVQACRRRGIKRLLHMSALNADASRGTSYYLRTKGDAESFLLASKDMDITIFRPSVIFGEEDSFLNRFASLLAKTPILPLACPTARMAPIYIGDVVSAFSHALTDRHTIGQRYDLCGPRSYSLKELVEYVAKLSGRRRMIWGLGDTMSKVQAFILDFMPGKPFSLDNYNSLQLDSVCEQPFPAIFNIKPTPLESIAPIYLQNKYAHLRYDHFRGSARRH